VAVPHLKLEPLPAGQVVVKAACWVQVFGFALLGCGLMTLQTDLSRPRGPCCTPLYWNHDAAIHFSALWCLLALLMAISSTQKLILRGGVLQVSWLWGAVHWSSPVERVRVQEIELRLRGGPTPALRIRLGWLPLYVTREFDGYHQFCLGLRVVADRPGEMHVRQK
jgi:hypothetical protein